MHVRCKGHPASGKLALPSPDELVLAIEEIHAAVDASFILSILLFCLNLPHSAICDPIVQFRPAVLGEELTNRLRAEGRWEQACKFRDKVRERRKAAGVLPWQAMATKYPPRFRLSWWTRPSLKASRGFHWRMRSGGRSIRCAWPALDRGTHRARRRGA